MDYFGIIDGFEKHFLYNKGITTTTISIKKHVINKRKILSEKIKKIFNL